jgi:hypothetical protein
VSNPITLDPRPRRSLWGRARGPVQQGTVDPGIEVVPPPCSSACSFGTTLELDLPFDLVEQSLLRRPSDWVPRVASEADARGELLLTEVGFGHSAYRVGKKVEIVLGASKRFPSKTVLPMTWRPRQGEWVFPLS